MTDSVQSRRLRPLRGLSAGARALPMLWVRGWPGLALLSLMLPMSLLTAGSEATRTLFVAVVAVLGLAVWTGLTAVVLERDPPIGAVALDVRLVRVVWAACLNLIFLAMILVVLALVSLAVFGMSGLDLEAIQAREWARLGPPWQVAVLGILVLVVLWVPLLLVVRLALFVQATVGRGHAVSLNTMGIAQGSFWPLLGLWLVLVVPPVALVTWIQVADSGGGLSVGGWLVLIWVWLPFAAAALGRAYQQVEYWKPGEGPT